MSGPDIFVSYAREDQARVALIVAALEARGWSVFWDRRIPAGQTWRSYIGRALDEARCVVVTWSEHSIRSEWVIEEADEGRGRGILVPVLLDPVRPPRGFRSIQAADLSRWSPEHPWPAFDSFLADVGVVLGKLYPKETSMSNVAPMPVSIPLADNDAANQLNAAAAPLTVKHGALTLIGLVISLPLVYWIGPNTGAGTMLLIVIVLLAVNVIGGLLRRSRQKSPTADTLPDH
jgi:hypothetical protein